MDPNLPDSSGVSPALSCVGRERGEGPHGLQVRCRVPRSRKGEDRLCRATAMTTTALIVLGAVALGGLAQSVAGLGLVLVCGPILVAVCGPSDGVRLAVTLSLALNVLVLLRWWHQ